MASSLALWPAVAAGQFGLTNLAEVRVGRDPFDPFPGVPASRFSRFDQFSLDYARDMLRLGFRHESYVPSDASGLEYNAFVRRYAGWSSGRFEAVLGNYEAIFGRGLVLRAFELPGVVREEVGTPQFGDSRDLDGLRFDAHGPRYSITALQGKPRRADEPPTFDRRGSVEGATAGFRITEGLHAGGHYLRFDAQSPAPGERTEVGGGFAQVGWEPWLERAGVEGLSLDTYVEYARATGLDIPAAVRSPNVEADAGYALYGSQGLFLEVLPGLRWGLSYEYKDYQHFELGVNEPPTLVREHSFALLNRTTHVLLPLQEEGYQIESKMNFRRRFDLTLNWSRAENGRSRQFRERYAELSAHVRGSTWTIFADEQSDGVESIADRDTYGGYGLVPFSGAHAVEIEVETQDVVRDLGASEIAFEDRYASLGYSWAGMFSLAFVRQTTTDPDEATDPVTQDIDRRTFDSITGSAQIGSHHELTLFWGRRRGGLACVAGTCYRVRAFDGVLARLITRF